MRFTNHWICSKNLKKSTRMLKNSCMMNVSQIIEPISQSHSQVKIKASCGRSLKQLWKDIFRFIVKVVANFSTLKILAVLGNYRLGKERLWSILPPLYKSRWLSTKVKRVTHSQSRLNRNQGGWCPLSRRPSLLCHSLADLYNILARSVRKKPYQPLKLKLVRQFSFLCTSQ